MVDRDGHGGVGKGMCQSLIDDEPKPATRPECRGRELNAASVPATRDRNYRSAGSSRHLSSRRIGVALPARSIPSTAVFGLPIIKS